MPPEGQDRGRRRVSILAQDSMAASGFSYRKPLVGTGWDISLLLSSISDSKAPFLVCMDDHW